MHIKKREVLKFLLFLSLTVVLFWLIYRDQDWNQLKVGLTHEVNYFWIGVSILLGIVSHLFRALRWKQLTHSLGYDISLPNSFMGVMIGYFANTAVPRMGEFTRCAVVNKYEKVPYSNLLGTVVTERILDVTMLLLFTAIAFLSQFTHIVAFFKAHKGIQEKASEILNSGWMLGIVALLALLAFGLYRLVKSEMIVKKARNFMLGVKQGIIAIKSVENKPLFYFYSLGIWLLYFLMLYVCFFSFAFTSHLSPLVGLTVFVLSSFGMLAPVQGGIGAWHFMVISALLLYIPDTASNENLAKLFAFVTHGTMTLLYIVVGVISMLVLPVYNSVRVKKVLNK